MKLSENILTNQESQPKKKSTSQKQQTTKSQTTNVHQKTIQISNFLN